MTSTHSVAAALRRTLEAEDVPVVVNLGHLQAGAGTRCISDNPSGRPKSDLARAEVYVLVQRAWEEGPITVELDGERFLFHVEFQPNDGSRSPVVRPGVVARALIETTR